MTINGKEYRFTIVPRWGKVEAEVYYLYKMPSGEDMEMHLVRKSFGSMFRGTINKDYDDAKTWAQNHIRQIYKANKDQ